MTFCKLLMCVPMSWILFNFTNWYKGQYPRNIFISVFLFLGILFFYHCNADFFNYFPLFLITTAFVIFFAVFIMNKAMTLFFPYTTVITIVLRIKEKEICNDVKEYKERLLIENSLFSSQYCFNIFIRWSTFYLL